MAIDSIKNGKVKLGGQAVKPSKEVKVGEIYTIQIKTVTRTIKVLDLLDKRLSAKEISPFMEDQTSQEELDKNKQSPTRFVFRPMGIGRPTKKERRDIDEWFDEKSDQPEE